MSQQKPNSKRTETARRILDTATEIFSESGFEGARVDEIAKRAGVNKATIYYHIGDKEALYARVIHDLFGNAAEQVNQNIKSALSPQNKLKKYIRTIAGIVDRYPEIAAIMLREQASGGKNLPELVARDIAGIVGIITDILDEGVEKGIFIETKPLIVHLMIIGAIVLLKMSTPIRSKYSELSDTLKENHDRDAKDAATEVERLVLNAVRK
ncbi:MAG: TetR/AcrR family transcriptional regulator [Deltaproteobacteria bacterium]|nr:TetR/AcrR family transcriptional regulator [Deltaproteobacteria bacterium]